MRLPILFPDDIMPDYQQIYRTQAKEYELLVSYEDCQQKILPALEQIRPLAGLEVVEFGAGTGRLTCLVAPFAKTIRAFDASAQMLGVTVAKLQTSGRRNWLAAVAEHSHLPVASGTADLCIAGWTFGHFSSWYPETWRREIAKVLREIERVLRLGGSAIILETLGTGQQTPQPPTEALAAYYAWLEGEHSFSSTWIRTDFCFDSLSKAQRLMRFFFDKPMTAAMLVSKEHVILPECTGIWWREY